MEDFGDKSSIPSEGSMRTSWPALRNKGCANYNPKRDCAYLTHPELRRFRRTTTVIVSQLQLGVDARSRLTVLALLGSFLDDCVAHIIDHLIENYSRLFGPMNLWLLGQLASYQVDRAARIT